MPGDVLVEDPKPASTRAVTIQATPAEIWQWLVQIGRGRGGPYSSETLENLVACDIHRTSTVLSEHQTLAVDDIVRSGGKDSYPCWPVTEVKPEKTPRSRAFNVFAGVLDVQSAISRFDLMLALADAVPYAKQPVIEKTTGIIVGYIGVGTVVFEDLDRLEWGWRFVAEAGGRGYATEATMALLSVAGAQGRGEMLCIIDVENHTLRRVGDKVGFRWWRRFPGPRTRPHPPIFSLDRLGPAALCCLPLTSAERPGTRPPTRY